LELSRGIFQPGYRVAEHTELSRGGYVNLGYRVANSFHWLKSGPEVTGYRVAGYRVGSTIRDGLNLEFRRKYLAAPTAPSVFRSWLKYLIYKQINKLFIFIK
jgi:hypothetical protein